MEKNLDETSVYVIRHGERNDQFKMQHNIDFTNPKYEHEQNTSITKRGAIQGYLTGSFIARQIRKKKYKNSKPRILILSSPYLRCIQTAINLVSGIKSNSLSIYHDSIFISDHLKEFQNKSNYMSKEDLRKELNDYLETQFKIPVKESKIPNDNFEGLEEIPDSYNRAKDFIRRLIKGKKMEGDNGILAEQKFDVIVCVTHAFFVKNLLLQFGNVMSANSPIEYCSLSKIVITPLRKYIDISNCGEVEHILSDLEIPKL